MAELVADCPRCGSNSITFDVKSQTEVGAVGWRHTYEAFCVCRRCDASTVFVLTDRGPAEATVVRSQGLSRVDEVVNYLVSLEGFVSLKDAATADPPEHLPQPIQAAFNEGARCLSTGAPNGAATMFRLCVDLATRGMLPAEETDGLNARIRRDLGLRLPWLFDHGKLPEALRDLSACIREDGNDGAHQGTLEKRDAEDVLDFATALLERIYTEPERLRLAKERRDTRRNPPPA